MGYLNNTSITVDAILTVEGRKILAAKDAVFNITQFALADDEIDYDLWNPDHPLGTAYYGATIENLPLIEALPDQGQMMKYKLVTLPKNAKRIPVVTVDNANPSPMYLGQPSTFTPSTANFTQGNQTYGYTAILSDSSLGNIIAVGTAPGLGADVTVPQFIGDSESSSTQTVQGKVFQFTADAIGVTKKGTITFIGNETGGRVTVNITVVGSLRQNISGYPLGSG